MRPLFQTLYRKVKALTFDKKISISIIVWILCISISILALTSWSAMSTITKKSTELAMRQMEFVTKNIEAILHDLNDVATLLISDDRILEYARIDKNHKKYAELANQSQSTINYIQNVKTKIKYILIVKYNDNSLQYTNKTWAQIDLAKTVRSGYESIHQTAYGNMKVNVSKDAFDHRENSLNLYQPIFDKYDFRNKTGLILISLDEKNLRDIYSADGLVDIPFETSIVNDHGQIISHSNTQELYTQSPYSNRLEGENGSFHENGTLVVYQFIQQWNWYVVGTIPTFYLLNESIYVSLLLIGATVMLCFGGSVICFKMVRSLYRPLEDIVTHMGKVSEGNMQTSMDEECYHGKDIKEIAIRFNMMVKEINLLMEQVKEEQHQLEQNRFLLLQSQIKPHFLYNVLECIHWQALVEGNTLVSVMVKSLASYYRICLSQGREIITLEEELDHIRHYLVIQNIRYGDIIESSVTVHPSFYKISIPKMTLQPLVENCIYHGIKSREGVKGRIIIGAEQSKSGFEIFVSDDGAGMTWEECEILNMDLVLCSGENNNSGYGIRNVHRRLELMFGKGFGLFYRPNMPTGTIVKITLPHEPHHTLDERRGCDV